MPGVHDDEAEHKHDADVDSEYVNATRDALEKAEIAKKASESAKKAQDEYAAVLKVKGPADRLDPQGDIKRSEASVLAMAKSKSSQEAFTEAKKQSAEADQRLIAITQEQAVEAEATFDKTKEAFNLKKIGDDDYDTVLQNYSSVVKNFHQAKVNLAKAHLNERTHEAEQERSPTLKSALQYELNLANAELQKAEKAKTLAITHLQVLNDPKNNNFKKFREDATKNLREAENAVSKIQLEQAEKTVKQSMEKVEEISKKNKPAEPPEVDNEFEESLTATKTELELANAKLNLDKSKLELIKAEQTGIATPNQTNNLAVKVAQAKLTFEQANHKAAEDAYNSVIADNENAAEIRSAAIQKRSPILEKGEKAAEARKLKEASAERAQKAAVEFENNPDVREKKRHDVLEETLKKSSELRKKFVSESQTIDTLKVQVETAAKAAVEAPENLALALEHNKLEQELKNAQEQYAKVQSEFKEIDAQRREQVGLIANIENAKKSVEIAKLDLERKKQVYEKAKKDGGITPNEEQSEKIEKAQQELTAAETALAGANADQSQAEQAADDVLNPKEVVKKQEAEKTLKNMKDFVDTEVKKAKLPTRLNASFQKFQKSDFGKYLSEVDKRLKGAKTPQSMKEEDLLEAAIINMLLLLFELLFGLGKGASAIYKHFNRDHLNSKEFRAMAKEDHAAALKEADKYKEDGEEPDLGKYNESLLKMAQAEATYAKYGRDEDNEKYDGLKTAYDHKKDELNKATKKRDEAKKAYDKAPFLKNSKEKAEYEKLKKEVRELEAQELVIYNKIKELNTKEGKHSTELEKMIAARNVNHQAEMDGAVEKYKGVQRYSEIESDKKQNRQDAASLEEQREDLQKDLNKCKKELSKPGLSEGDKTKLEAEQKELGSKISALDNNISSKAKELEELEKLQENLGLDDPQIKMAKAEEERGQKVAIKDLMKDGKELFNKLKDWVAPSKELLSGEAGENLDQEKDDEADEENQLAAAAGFPASSSIVTISSKPTPTPASASEQSLPPVTRARSAGFLTPPGDAPLPHAELSRSASAPDLANPSPAPETPVAISFPRTKPPKPNTPAPENSFSNEVALNHGKNVTRERLLSEFEALMTNGSPKPGPAPSENSEVLEKRKVTAIVGSAYRQFKTTKGSTLHTLAQTDKEFVQKRADDIMTDPTLKKQFLDVYDKKAENKEKQNDEASRDRKSSFSNR